MATLGVFAGPNGSGKSAIISAIQDERIHVDADEIQRLHGCTALEAAKIAEKTRETLLANGEDFTFETVLSTTRNLELMRRAKAKGYDVSCLYALTRDPKINIRRVKARAARGLHDVPEDKVYIRYIRALRLFPQLLDICDELSVYDNSLEWGQGFASLIIQWDRGALELRPNAQWPQENLESLMNGHYSDRFVPSGQQVDLI